MFANKVSPRPFIFANNLSLKWRCLQATTRIKSNILFNQNKSVELKFLEKTLTPHSLHKKNDHFQY